MAPDDIGKIRGSVRLEWLKRHDLRAWCHELEQAGDHSPVAEVPWKPQTFEDGHDGCSKIATVNWMSTALTEGGAPELPLCAGKGHSRAPKDSQVVPNRRECFA